MAGQNDTQPPEETGPKIYTQAQLDIQINKVRITERFNAWVTMADNGIPAEKIPKPYREARDIVFDMVNAPAKSAVPAEGPAVPPGQ